MNAAFKYLAVVAAVLLALWYVDHRGYGRGAADVRAEVTAANLAATTAANERIKNAGEQHAKDQLTINRLAADANRVRIHIPDCADAAHESTNGASRILSDRVDEEFRKFQEEVGRIIQRADQLNLDAARLNAELP